MKTIRFFMTSVLAVALLGCGKPEPRHFVILPDVSGSIDRESLEQAFKAIDELAAHLQREDSLTIIPILGDAEAEASGKILRFEVPANRQAYDTDLRDFRSKLNASLQEIRANAVAHPGSKSDILGAVALAEQEFDKNPKPSKRELMILSDFIQEANNVDFRSDKSVASEVAAKEFAKQIANANDLNLKGMPVYLGHLRSNEYIAIQRRRRAAIQAFWINYFRCLGGVPSFAVDGPGLLQSRMTPR
jgi:hypothetical protein